MRNLTGKITLAIGLATILFSSFLFYLTYSLTDQRISEVVQRQAALGLQFNLSIRNYVASHVRPLMYQLLGEDEFIPEVMSTSFVARSVFEDVPRGHRTPPRVSIAQSRMAIASASLSSLGLNPRARMAAMTSSFLAFPLRQTLRFQVPTGTPW